MTAPIEIWKPVVGWPKYQVSDLGNVKGHSGKILTPRVHSSGYLRIAARDDGRAKDLYIHRMVLEAFAGLAPEGHEADHINKARADNRLSNLRWITAQQNKANRTFLRGERSPNARLTQEQVLQIRAANDVSLDGFFASQFGVGRRHVNDIRRKVCWS
jgi:hypothetical protein